MCDLGHHIVSNSPSSTQPPPTAGGCLEAGHHVHTTLQGENLPLVFCHMRNSTKHCDLHVACHSPINWQSPFPCQRLSPQLIHDMFIHYPFVCVYRPSILIHVYSVCGTTHDTFESVLITGVNVCKHCIWESEESCLL